MYPSTQTSKVLSNSRYRPPCIDSLRRLRAERLRDFICICLCFCCFSSFSSKMLPHRGAPGGGPAGWAPGPNLCVEAFCCWSGWSCWSSKNISKCIWNLWVSRPGAIYLGHSWQRGCKESTIDTCSWLVGNPKIIILLDFHYLVGWRSTNNYSARCW